MSENKPSWLLFTHSERGDQVNSVLAQQPCLPSSPTQCFLFPFPAIPYFLMLRWTPKKYSNVLFWCHQKNKNCSGDNFDFWKRGIVVYCNSLALQSDLEFAALALGSKWWLSVSPRDIYSQANTEGYWPKKSIPLFFPAGPGIAKIPKPRNGLLMILLCYHSSSIFTKNGLTLYLIF